MLAASGAALTLDDQEINDQQDLTELPQSDLEFFEPEYDSELRFLSQITTSAQKLSEDSKTQWTNNSGLVKTTFPIPEKNCCIFYSEMNLKGLRTEPLCYDYKTKVPVTKFIQDEVRSMDCGGETFANVSSDM